MGATVQAARAWLSAEVAAQADRWTLWAPVAFGAGAAVYLLWPREPALWSSALAAVVLLTLAIGARRWGGRTAAVLCALLTFAGAGHLAGKVRTTRVAAPAAPAPERPVTVEGLVVDIASPGAGGGRLLLAPVRVGDAPAEALPLRLRVGLRGQDYPPPGAWVRMLAVVRPPPGPAAPGAYDFGRDAFFRGIGGSALALGELRPAEARPLPWRLRAAVALNGFRWRLTQHVVAATPGEGAGLAAAMVTGHEAFVTPEVEDAMRDSGLAHVISISGLHMAVVGGVAFLLVRLLVAAWPWLAVRTPGKKAAAVAGLLAVGGYLLISGAPPPAQRAAITAAVAFGAVLADRRAISLHALAVAALLILLLQPEAVAQPGFQMSFAATTALVALAEAWPRPVRELSAPRLVLFVQAAGAWLLVSLAASFVAGLATGPFAVQHFNRVAVWSLPANLLTAPLSSFVFMPALFLGALLTPLGLDGPAFAVAGAGIEAMLGVARLAQAAPHASAVVASAPAAALPASMLGVLLLCLWRGRLRWLGLPLAGAVLLWPRPPAPAAWIAAGGASAAVVAEGRAVSLRPDAQAFAAELWARRRGLTPPAETEQPPGYDCTRTRCLPDATAPGPRIAAWWTRRPPKAAEVARACGAADLLLWRATGPPPAGCRARVLTRAALEAGGAAEVLRDGPGWRLRWTEPARGRRPWTPSWTTAAAPAAPST